MFGSKGKNLFLNEVLLLPFTFNRLFIYLIYSMMIDSTLQGGRQKLFSNCNNAFGLLTES